jgi:hypothetical protein
VPIALSGTPSTTNNTAAGTTLTVNVPAGIANGDLLIWHMIANNATVASTPAGWNVVKTGTTTTHNQSIFWRVAASEPASYTHAALTSAKWTFSMYAFSGVDNTTPLDIASASIPAMTAGTTAVTLPAITPVTAGAWIIGTGSAIGATTATFAFSSSNSDGTVVLNQPATSGVNPSHGTFWEAWVSGAFTPLVTFTGTSTRTLGSTYALRPSAGVSPPPPPAAAGRVQTLRYGWR